MKTIFYGSAVMLLSAAALAPGLAAQPAPGAAGAPGDRCAALRDAMAKHPAPNAAAEERWRKRLAECEAGQKSSPDPAQPDPPGQGGEGAEPGQPAGTEGEGTGNAGAPTLSVAPTSSAHGRSVSSGTASRMAGRPSANLANATPTFSSLHLAVFTGDDDLRSDSRAWVTVRAPDGAEQQCPLKEGDGWFENNSSSNKIVCKLNLPLTAEQLRATRFRLEYDGQPGGNIRTAEDTVITAAHGYDNWKVTEVRIAATGPSQNAQCLVDAKGSPLVELTQDNRRFELRGGC